MSCCPPECCYYTSCGSCTPCGPCGPCTPCAPSCTSRCDYSCARSCCDCRPPRLENPPMVPAQCELRKKPKCGSQVSSATAKKSCSKRTGPLKGCSKKCPSGADDDALGESPAINSSNYTSVGNASCFNYGPANCCNFSGSNKSSNSMSNGGSFSKAKGRSQSSYDPKQTKNKKNFQYQDMKKRMEVINEDPECDSDREDTLQNKNIQDSCADFLNIVHDTVLETVQCSVESILRNYYKHTMERIETLSSQMMRNECLLSKMYLDVLDKLSQQSDKSMRQFKCMCQFLADFDKSSRNYNGRSECSCNCAEEAVMKLTRDRATVKGRRLSRQSAGRESDTEGRTDGSLTSCTLPKLQAKGKIRDPETSRTSVLEDGRNRRHNSGYSEVRQRAGEDAAACRTFISPQPSDEYRTLNVHKTHATDSRLLNIRTGSSEVDVLRKNRQ